MRRTSQRRSTSRRRRCSRRSCTRTRGGCARCGRGCASGGYPFVTQPDLRPAIVQDADSGRVLMLAWMDDEAERRTRESGEAWFWSRSRQEYWRKGATSGNTLAVEELRDDGDGDALLLRVRPAGPACHTGSLSCFAPPLWRVISERAAERPDGSYTAELLDGGVGACA